MAEIEFWYDFASTYSYLTAMRIEPLAKAAGVRVAYRPFLLGPIFKAQGLTTSPFAANPVKGSYMARDIGRIAADRGLVFHIPDPFPAHSLAAARIAMVAEAEGWIDPFTHAVFAAEFASREDIAATDVLIRIVSGLGHDPARTFVSRRHSRNQGGAARAHRCGSSKGYLRRPHVRDRGRRAFLGRRPPRTGARVGRKTTRWLIG